MVSFSHQYLGSPVREKKKKKAGHVIYLVGLFLLNNKPPKSYMGWLSSNAFKQYCPDFIAIFSMWACSL